MRRQLSYAIAFASGGLVAAVVFFAGPLLNEPPRAALVRDLPTETLKVEPAWDERLARDFPTGTPEAKLITGLSAAGFAFLERDGRLWASLDIAAVICVESYFVEWSVDSSSRIATIDGGFHLSCL